MLPKNSSIIIHILNQSPPPITITRRNTSCTPTVMSIRGQQTSSWPRMTDSQGLRLSRPGSDVPEKSISEKVAEARRYRRESTPIQHLFVRNNVPTVTPTSHALLLSSNNRRSGPKARNSSGEITTGPVNGGDHAGTTMNAGTTNDDMSITSNEADGSGKVTTSEGHHVDAPKVQTRADSAQTFRRGRSLFRSSAPKVRRHARPPFPTTSRIEEETAAVLPLRRLESLSPKPRFSKGGTNRLSRGRQKHNSQHL